MSRDIKGTSLDQLNDGLETAVRRAKRQLSSQIADAEQNAVKTAIRISSEQINRTRTDLKNRINDTNNRLAARIEETQKKLGARIDQQAKETAKNLAAMDKKHTAALAKLSDDVYDAIDRQNQHIADEVGRLDKNIGILNKGLHTLNDNMQQLATDVDKRFRAQQSNIDSLRQDVKSIFEKQANDLNSKLLAAGAALAMLEAIRERTDVARYAPQHMLDNIALKEQRLREITRNPDSCSITDANNLMDEALVMENEARRIQAEWEPAYQATLLAAMSVLGLLEKNESMKVPSLYDESEEELKADYWTHGAYNKLLQEIKDLKRQIETAPVNIALLKELHAKVKELQDKAEKMIVEAAELGTLSEQRVIISNDVLNAMVSQGWELKEDPDFLGGETESDWREGTFAVLAKPGTGEEVSILVLPEEKGGKKGNQIIFHRNDDLLESAGAFQTRMEEIKREIEKSGYKLGALKEPEHGGDGKIDQLRSGKNMRSKGAAQKLNSTLGKR